MTLDKSNLLARFYHWCYGELPNDFCSYFWNSVWAIILLPLHWIITINNRTEPLLPRSFLGAFITVGTFALAVAGARLLAFFGAPPVWWTYLLGLVVIAAIIAATIGAGVLVAKLRLKRDYSKPSTAEKIAATYGAVRNKYCTKIEWQ